MQHWRYYIYKWWYRPSFKLVYGNVQIHLSFKPYKTRVIKGHIFSYIRNVPEKSKVQYYLHEEIRQAIALQLKDGTTKSKN